MAENISFKNFMSPKSRTAKIQISDLKLRTIIGTNDWERTTKQEVLINISLEHNATKAIATDNLKDTVDYRALTKRIIKEVEGSRFLLLEKLTDYVLNIVMENPKVKNATVRIDKPRALRFARSVSVELSAKRSNA